MSDLSPAVVNAVPAATVLLVRDEPAFEVLMVKRHHQIDFASGALVFPGGKAEPGDSDPAWAALATGWRPDGGVEQALKISAIREAFEESGVLLARDPLRRALVRRASRGGGARRRGQGRAGLHRPGGRAGPAARSGRHGHVYARWITPVNMPKRFDTWFFIATAPEDQLAACDGWETVDAEWIAPSEALSMARAGTRKVIFPTRMNLQLLAESRSADEAIAAARGRTLVVVEPKVVQRDEGPVLILPPDAGYGAVEEAFSAAM